VRHGAENVLHGAENVLHGAKNVRHCVENVQDGLKSLSAPCSVNCNCGHFAMLMATVGTLQC
jgi:hypothetical protein